MKNLKFLNLIALTFISLLISCNSGTKNETDTTVKIVKETPAALTNKGKVIEQIKKRTSSTNIIKEGTIDLTKNNLIFNKIKMFGDQENSLIFNITDRLGSSNHTFNIDTSNYISLSVQKNILSYTVSKKKESGIEFYSIGEMTSLFNFHSYKSTSKPIIYTQIGETDWRIAPNSIGTSFFGLNYNHNINISINFHENSKKDFTSFFQLSIENTKSTNIIIDENIIQINSTLFQNVVKLND